VAHERLLAGSTRRETTEFDAAATAAAGSNIGELTLRHPTGTAKAKPRCLCTRECRAMREIMIALTSFALTGVLVAITESPGLATAMLGH
jgi:hypothetical protein